jgi:hypothetical protein
MTGVSLEEEVRFVCQRGMPWYSLASVLYSRISTASSRETAEIKALACAVSGYSVGLLNRYISTYARMKMIAEASGLQPIDLLSPVFNGVEAAVKLYDVDQHRGLDALLRLKDGKTTLAAVRTKLVDAKELQSAAAGLSILPRRLNEIERRRRQASIVRSLQNGFAPLHGKYEKVDWRKADRLLKCENLYLVDRGDQDQRRSAVEMIDAGPASDLNSIDTIIPSAILRSSFFKHYYLVFWKAETDVLAKRAVRLLNWLEVDSIGVLTVEFDGLVRGHPDLPYYLPEPEHDRSPKLEEMLNADY